MSKEISIGLYTPSYRRSDMIRTYDIIKTTYVVRESERLKYLDAGIEEEDLWAVEDSLISDYEYVFEYIVENAKEDIVCIIDDDIDGIIYRQEDAIEIWGEEAREPLLDEIERTAVMVNDLGIGLATSTATATPFGYRGPWLFKGTPGSVKIINRHAIKAHMDTKVGKMCDIDYVMQEVLHNRICLQPWYYIPATSAKINNQYGKTRATGSSYDGVAIDASVEYMKAKWGKAFRYDEKRRFPVINVKR